MKNISEKRAWVGDYGLYGIFGYPLDHSFSPQMHNAAFRALGLKNFYISLPVPPERFRKLAKKLKGIPLDGFNLTVPHKELALGALTALDPEAKRIGAVNTVVCLRNAKPSSRKLSLGRHATYASKLVGYNTDGFGFTEALKKKAKFRMRGASVIILGSGGAARACVHSLIKENAQSILVVNRTLSKAQKIIQHFSKAAKKQHVKISASSLAALRQSRSPASKEDVVSPLLKKVDLLVNATSLGLKKSDPLPLDLKVLGKKKILIMDLIYNPGETKLLREAARLGHSTMNGLAMLLYQGARAFEIWTGRKAPIDVMEHALQEAGAETSSS